MSAITEDIRRRTIEMLFAERCSCVVRSADGRCHVLRQRGIRDLHDLLHDGRRVLDGAFVADKVVGKGAAALMIAGGVKEFFADVVSREALELAERYNLKFKYNTLTEQIINRAGTGRCPVETLCSGLRGVEECLAKIDEFIEKQKRNEQPDENSR